MACLSAHLIIKPKFKSRKLSRERCCCGTKYLFLGGKFYQVNRWQGKWAVGWIRLKSSIFVLSEDNSFLQNKNVYEPLKEAKHCDRLWAGMWLFITVHSKLWLKSRQFVWIRCLSSSCNYPSFISEGFKLQTLSPDGGKFHIPMTN